MLCLCEHAAHFDKKHEHKHPIHDFCHDVGEVVRVHTIYGVLDMCRDCANAVPAQFLIRREP